MLQHTSTDSRLLDTILTALVPTWDSGEETLVFPRNGEFVCGKSLISAARILVPGVADEHCLMECREGRATVLPIDHQVVSVNDQPVSHSALLEAGDVLTIGPAQFRVEVRQPGRFCRPNVFARKQHANSESTPSDFTDSPTEAATPVVPGAQEHDTCVTPDATESKEIIESDQSLPTAPIDNGPPQLANTQQDSATLLLPLPDQADGTTSVPESANAAVDFAVESTTDTDAAVDTPVNSSQDEGVVTVAECADAAKQPVPQNEEWQSLLEDNADLKQQLEVANADADALRQEREELQTAVAELKTAFEAVRDELIASQAYVLTNDDSEGNPADSSAEDHEQELQEAERTVREQQDLIDTLQQQMSELAERFEAEAESIRREAQAAAREEAPDADAGLLEEIAQLRLELSQAMSESDDTTAADAEIDGYQQLILELKDQLQLAHEQLNQFQESADVAINKSAFPETTLPAPLAEDFSETFRQPQWDAEPQSQAEAKQAAGESVQQYVSQIFGNTTAKQDELDSARDAEPDVSSRADILGAFSVQDDDADKFHPTAFEEETQQPVLDDFNSGLTEADSVETAPDASERPSVRSEIAELFGITNNAFQEKPEEERRVSAAAELMSAVDDYSQEDSAAVSMSFSEAEQVLLRPKSSLRPEPEVSLEDEDESHDDFVSQYMEQLLSRNRQSAGGSLPEELTRPQSRDRSAASQTAVQEKPKRQPQSSFIDQYMSGTFSPADASVDGAVVTQAPGTESDGVNTVSRPKIDIRLLRQNMDSFREISSRSIENALTTHAKRRQRGNLMKRATILGALSLLSVLVVVASLTGAIPFGLLAWLSITAVAVSGGELLWKVKSIHTEAEQAAARFSNSPGRPNQIPQLRAVTGNPESQAQDASVLPMTEPHSSTSTVGENSDGAETRVPHEDVQPAARGLLNSTEELYFEQ